MKYIKLALLPIAFILLCYSITYASNTIKGDINGVDGITLEDTVLALQLSAGYSTQNQKVNANADINGDGVIGTAEVAYILRVLKQENVELIITGDWRAHSIDGGEWSRMDLTVDSSGNYTVSWVEAGGDSGTDQGSFSINNEGIIHGTDESPFEGVMGPEHDFFVYTEGHDGSDPSSELGIAVRQP